MFLEELEVRGIRNLQPQTIRFERRVTVVFGRNGQGKTSLLEAIYLLSQSRSFRTPQRKDVISWSGEERRGSIRGVVRSGVGTREIALVLERGRRTLTLDGKRAEEAGQFFGQLRCVTFTPEELLLVKGPPQIRRQYIDRTLSLIDAGYLRELVQYQRALKQRNALLARPGTSPGDELLPWEMILAESAVPIARARRSFLESIGPSCERFYRELANRGAGAGGECISLCYHSDLFAGGALITAADALRLFSDNRTEDRRLRSTQTGIHRDDLEVRFAAAAVQGSARSLASQGQTRTIALAMKLAAIDCIESRSGEAPLVLLDDVESELDSLRREGLFEFLRQSRNQVLITTTDPSWAPAHRDLEVAAFSIENGLISRVS